MTEEVDVPLEGENMPEDEFPGEGEVLPIEGTYSSVYLFR